MAEPASVERSDREKLFERCRDLLRGVAYRLLGRYVDAEDVVQEAWLRWSRVDVATVSDPEAYLVRVVTRLAIDRLRGAQKQRESYIGPWLPEPVLTAPDIAEDVVRADSVSTAVLLLMENLTPLERAVLVLHDVFGYSYAEIARFIDRGEDAVRQTAYRARRHIHSGQRRYDVDRRTLMQVTEAFFTAAEGGDIAALMALLAPDVKLVADGGGLAPAPRKPIIGSELVVHALLTFSRRLPPDMSIRVVDLNGRPGALIFSGSDPAAALTFGVRDGRIEALYVVSNPEKLAGVVAVRPIR